MANDPAPMSVPPAGHRRIEAKKLTEGELDDLKEQGLDIEGDFVDIPVPKSKPMRPVDTTAKQKQDAIAMLESVVDKGESREEVETSAPVDDSRVQDLEARLEAVEAERDALRKQVDDHPDNCPKCNWHLNQPLFMEPSKDDIENFLYSVVSGERYSREYRLFGGSMTVVFGTRTSLEEKGIRETISNLMRADKIKSDDELINRLEQLQFLCSLREIRVSKGEDTNTISLPVLHDILENDSSKLAGLDHVLEEATKDIPSQALLPARGAYRKFAFVVDFLMSRAEDQSFWQGSPDSIS